MDALTVRARTTSLTALLAAVLTTLAAWALTTAPAAHAGSYDVYTCSGATSNNAWLATQSGTGTFTAYTDCFNPGSYAGIITRNSVGGGLAPYLHGAIHRFAIPGDEARATRMRAEVKIDAGNYGYQAGVTTDENGFVWCGTGMCSSYDAFVPLDLSLNTRGLQIGSVCVAGGGCDRGDVRVRMMARNVIVTVNDPSVAVLTNGRGTLWTTDGWKTGGGHTAGFDALDDESGIKRTQTDLDGGTAEVAGVDRGCDYSRPRPCDDHGHDATINLTGVGDGAHQLRLNALNGSGDWSTVTKTIYVDNTAPSAPSTPTLTGTPASQWRSTNGFQLNYSVPGAGSGSPISSATAELCPVDATGQITGSCTAMPASLSGATTINLPNAGMFKARFRVADALRQGAWSDWSAVLRYDPVVPGKAFLDRRNGWYNAAESLPQTISFPTGAQIGPSSIKGYSVNLDSAQDPSTSAPTITASPDRTATYTLPALGEGVHTIKARAFSGANVPSNQVDATTIQIDNTAPAVTITGAPDGSDPGPSAWQQQPVTLTITGTDQDGLSGMAASPDGSPATEGGYVETKVGEGAWATHKGATGTVTVDDDGDHVIRYRATDLAGNTSDIRQIRVRINRAAVSGGFDPVDPNDPRTLSMTLEGCVQNAVIQVRPVGGAWTDLPTTVNATKATATIPEDTLASGAYEFRGVATNCAGVQSTITTWIAGARAGQQVALNLPVRIPTVLRSSLKAEDLCRTTKRTVRTKTGKRRVETKLVCPSSVKRTTIRRTVRTTTGKKKTVRTVKYVGPRTINRMHGTLLTDQGVPVPGAPVDVQANVADSGWQRISTIRTAADGSLTYTIPAGGPSRQLRFAYDGTSAVRPSQSNAQAVTTKAAASIKAAKTKLVNGQTARFSGTVIGGYIPPVGRLVELQAYAGPKKKWVAVSRAVRTDKNGRWTTSYRFVSTARTIRYKFRLRVPTQAGFPYSEGFSKTITVLVRGTGR